MTQKAEQFIKDCTKCCSNEIEDGCYHEWLTPEQAKAACIIERKETIKDICDFIKVNVYKYGKIKISMHGLPSFDFRMNTYLNDLKQTMEE